MSDLISRQEVIDEIEERINANGYSNVTHISELNRLEGYIRRLPSAQPDDHRYEQGIIEGRVQMRTEILKGIKNLVGDEIWQMI